MKLSSISFMAGNSKVSSKKQQKIRKTKKQLYLQELKNLSPCAGPLAGIATFAVMTYKKMPHRLVSSVSVAGIAILIAQYCSNALLSAYNTTQNVKKINKQFKS